MSESAVSDMLSLQDPGPLEDATPWTWAWPWSGICCSAEDPALLNDTLDLLLDPKWLREWGTFTLTVKT